MTAFQVVSGDTTALEEAQQSWEGAPPRSSSSTRPSWAARMAGRDRLVVALLTGLALGLRAPYLGRAFWIDEGITIGISSHPLAQLPQVLRKDGSPPLFYVLFHFWAELFGTSEVAAHALPLALSLAAVPAGYWAGRELFDRRAGLAAAALMATNPYLNWFATEARMYTLVVLLSCVGLALALRATRRRSVTDAALAVAAYTALVYTHDWGIYLTAATAAVLAFRAQRSDDRPMLKGVILAAAAVLVLWLPWAPAFLDQARATAAPWAVRPSIGDLFADPSTALAGTAGVLVVPVTAAAVWVLRRSTPAERRAHSSLLAAIALVMILLGFVGAQVDPSWTVRYMAVLVGPFLLAAAGVLSWTAAGRRAISAVCALLAVWAVIGMLLPNPSAHFAKDNVGAVAAEARPFLQAGDLVVVTQTEQVPVARHYLPDHLYYVVPTGPVADPGVVDWRDIVARLRAAQPCSAVAPYLDALPVGADVLEINPLRPLGSTGTAWSRAVNGQVLAVDQLLADDPALQAVEVMTPDVRPKPYAVTDGIVFRKISDQPACS